MMRFYRALQHHPNKQSVRSNSLFVCLFFYYQREHLNSDPKPQSGCRDAQALNSEAALGGVIGVRTRGLTLNYCQ